MNDSTAILARFMICKVVRVVLVELCFAKMNDSTTIVARFVICADCARCACRVVLCENERQYCDFGKICDLHGLCALCSPSCVLQNMKDASTN